ncbi:MAG: HAD-IB family hydrolase [Gammaproteobacteria bacterium]|nr:HAD-IB family hydrolase [Gammaproteobacteria bacterium]
MNLVIFDLDNTLIGGDSDYLWMQFLVQNKLVDPIIYKQKSKRFHDQYLAGTLNIYEFVEFRLAPLTQLSMTELGQLHNEFMEQIITSIWLPKAEALLKKHRANNDFLLIITATNHFVAAPIAKKLGVDDILATMPEKKAGVYTGKVAGTPCFQEGKIKNLSHWLQTNNFSFANIYFYSDSINDLPLLREVNHPIAVDPDIQLSNYATKHSWPIISLRRNVLLCLSNSEWRRKTMRKKDYGNRFYVDLCKNDAVDTVNMCKSKNINILIPSTYEDALFLDKNRKLFETNNIRYLIPTYETIILFGNKSAFVDFMYENNLSEYVPQKYDKIELPCVIKKNVSYYGHGIHVVQKAEDIPKDINLNEYLIQEAITGDTEYSTDLLVKNGSILYESTLKLQYATQLYVQGYNNGNPVRYVRLDENILNVFANIVKLVNYNGFCCISYKVDIFNVLKIFEINPRMGGSIALFNVNPNIFINRYISALNSMAKRDLLSQDE